LLPSFFNTLAMQMKTFALAAVLATLASAAPHDDAEHSRWAQGRLQYTRLMTKALTFTKLAS
jgi:hypothetical protein